MRLTVKPVSCDLMANKVSVFQFNFENKESSLTALCRLLVCTVTLGSHYCTWWVCLSRWLLWESQILAVTYLVTWLSYRGEQKGGAGGDFTVPPDIANNIIPLLLPCLQLYLVERFLCFPVGHPACHRRVGIGKHRHKKTGCFCICWVKPLLGWQHIVCSQHKPKPRRYFHVEFSISLYL